MANTKISALTSATTPLAGTEVLPIVQSGATVKVATNDLTVRNVRANATTGILQVTGPAAASTRVVTVPDANFTAARTDAAQSFTGDQTLSTGNLVIGTSGKGIDFSADSSAAGMTSELLDDYEEGTWTPVLTIGGTTETIGSVYAAYTKIGRQVTVQFKFSVDSVTGTGNVVVSLPFTATSSANQILMFPIGANKVSWTGAVLAAEIAPSATTFSVVGIVNSTASSAANVTNSNVTTASQLRGAFTYFVD
jgi:hypothetical protein